MQMKVVTSDDDDNDGEGGKPAAAAEITTPLKQTKSIWEDDKVHVDKSNKQWTCLWCNRSFLLNATKAVAHLSKTKSEVHKCVGR